MFNIRKKWTSSLLLRKIGWTLVIVMVYIIGRFLPVPTAAVNQKLVQNFVNSNLLNNLATVTGARISSITLFSLGLSPWMTTVIIWRFFTVFNLFKNQTQVQVYRYRMMLTLVIAAIQAFGLTASTNLIEMDLFGIRGEGIALFFTMLILASGSVVLTWLGNMNASRGLGGMTIMILVNMILSFIENGVGFISEQSGFTMDLLGQIALFIVAYTLLVLLTVILYRGEYRIPIKRVGIHTSYNQKSYLPIRVTPAGAMPFMYGMTLMMLPAYLLNGLRYFYPENETLKEVAFGLSLTQLSGALFYITLLYVLSIGFAYYNYDSYDIAKNMRNNGDYIEGVRPGKDTKDFVQRKVNSLAQFGALTVMLIVGLPLIFLVAQWASDGSVSIALLINNAYIVSSLLLGVIEQVNTIQGWKQYKNVIYT
ncbi:accessory Sec system protein translocase subunit SecY2 [Streptococcus sp. NLN76]|uniref:accessory Sec system protein translocase subunit SecY2 n=1 Tax=Streptococcus sp. NLN76 TaxID=2822800 RepID=UPI0018AC1808|nr:accessory Sec system protein translocase subunit SecY2 [Streptococcus sp. NLN76]MBF8970459.1 accessory Sec system protein translocase subunit SecY2 [Streptococcus sp. NLN76]